MASSYDRALGLGLAELTVEQRVELGLAISGRAWTTARQATVWTPATVYTNVNGTLRVPWFAPAGRWT